MKTTITTKGLRTIISPIKKPLQLEPRAVRLSNSPKIVNGEAVRLLLDLIIARFKMKSFGKGGEA